MREYHDLLTGLSHTAMVVTDMTIEKMFLEGGEVVKNSEPDPFAVSTAESILQYCTDNK